MYDKYAFNYEYNQKDKCENFIKAIEKRFGRKKDKS